MSASSVSRPLGRPAPVSCPSRGPEGHLQDLHREHFARSCPSKRPTNKPPTNTQSTNSAALPGSQLSSGTSGPDAGGSEAVVSASSGSGCTNTEPSAEPESSKAIHQLSTHAHRAQGVTLVRHRSSTGSPCTVQLNTRGGRTGEHCTRRIPY